MLDLFDAVRARGQSHFTFIQNSYLTHGYLNHAGYIDRPFSIFLKRFFAAGHHRNTLVFLYSDHGLRYGPILKTRSGIYEQRLPFFYVYVPDEFQLEPTMDSAAVRRILSGNQRRLTSHYDVHATFRHVLEGRPPVDEKFGRSLFTEIPTDRSCQQAGIDSNYCLCHPLVPVANSAGEVDQMAEAVVTRMNQLLEPMSRLCEPLRLRQTTMALRGQTNESEQQYLLQLVTDPGGGEFEAIVLATDGTSNSSDFTVAGSMSRLNEYGHQAYCVLNKFRDENLCYCHSLEDSKKRNSKT